MIQTCLESVRKLADEIVFLDNNSQDKTVEIARKYTKNILIKDFEGYANERNILAKEAKGDWILYIDADERISAQLKDEILTTVKDTQHSAFGIPRKNILLGKWQKYGGWWPDYQIRLFRKSDFLGWEGKLHESPKFKGTLGHLENPLIHLTHRDIVSMMEKTAKWSEVEAQLRLQASHPEISGWRLARVALTEFCGRFFRKQGFRDGTEGWIESIFQAFSVFITYARLWEMQRQEKLSQTYKKFDEELLKGGFKL